MYYIAGMIVLGLLAGIFSGALGIGGAIFIVPILVYVAGMDQKVAQGTTLLLMLPPIGILAVLEYARRGQLHWPSAAWICIGFVVGGYVGARLIADVPPILLKRVFGLVLLVIGIKMMFKP